MTTPLRLQLSRRKGFRLQAASRAANSLEAVNVARPSKWGNPYRKDVHGLPEKCMALFRRFAYQAFRDPGWRGRLFEELRRRNLACWCRPGSPYHADLLLELANAKLSGVTHGRSGTILPRKAGD